MIMPGEIVGTTVRRTIDILSCLAQGMDRIADISSYLNFNKSTVHRLLNTLVSNGFVIKDITTRRYYLGLIFVDLATKPLTAHKVLILSAANEMDELRQLSHETVILHIPIGMERICISEFESLQDIKYTAGVGSIAPIYVGSAGKLLLSEMNKRDINLIIKNLKMEQIGPNTITNGTRLLKELDKIRELGYAESRGERLAHAVSISVPIKNYICPVSLSILGPEDRFSPNLMHNILPAMIDAAERISQGLFKYKTVDATKGLS
jgi:DNA-binding IclR family transcriptional regulator